LALKYSNIERGDEKKMKKLLAVLMSAMLLMAFIGCKPKPKEEETAPAAPPAEQAPAEQAPAEQAPAEQAPAEQAPAK